MRDPRRLLEQDATDAERALLRSAHADEPPAGAAQRTMLALGGLTVGSGGTTEAGQALGGSASSVPVAAQGMKLGALAKVSLAALIGAGALGGGMLVQGLASRPLAPAESSAPGAPVQPAAPVPGLVENLGTTVAPSRATAPAVHPPVPGQRPAPLSDDLLSAELRILDTARAAVDARHPEVAQRALDGYAQRFPHGHLNPEATVLHLAVLVQQGDHAGARSLAARLLASETYKAYEPRIRSWLREAEE